MCQAGVFNGGGFDAVRANLSDFPGITFTRGWLPQSLEGIPARRYKFVNVDVDLYVPTKGAFDYFYRDWSKAASSPAMIITGRVRKKPLMNFAQNMG